jgi:hypothetical protein
MIGFVLGVLAVLVVGAVVLLVRVRQRADAAVLAAHDAMRRAAAERETVRIRRTRTVTVSEELEVQGMRETLGDVLRHHTLDSGPPTLAAFGASRRPRQLEGGRPRPAAHYVISEDGRPVLAEREPYTDWMGR